MRNYIKYSPLEWREYKGHCVPVGPSFSWARPKTVTIAGSNVTFTAPNHESGTSDLPSDYNHRDPINILKDYACKDEVPDSIEHWVYGKKLNRYYGFFGPWFTGEMGLVQLYMSVIQPEFPNPDLNFFHPNVFELAVTSYLHFSYGREIDYTLDRHIAPVNWQTVSGLGVPAARFDLVSNRGNGLPDSHSFMIAIGPAQILEFYFYYYDNSSRLKGLEVSREPMLTLINQIVESVSIELCPESQTMCDAVKTEGNNVAQITTEFLPLKWGDSFKWVGLPVDERPKDEDDGFW